MINVFVVDDHPVVREGIVSIISSAEDMEVVGQAADGREALAAIAEFTTAPDVVLMDLRMPLMDGVTTTAYLRTHFPGVTIVILTTYETDEDILSAIEAGATEMCLHAQARLESWYGLMGYTRFGEVDYEDEGQPHIWMEKTISRP